MTELQLWVSAIEIGCFYGAIALCYLLVLDGAGFFNFAIGPFAMFTGLATSWLVIEKEYALWPAVVLGVLGAIVLSILTELIVIRPIDARSGGGDLPALVAVAAVLFAVQQGAGYFFGRRTLPGRQLLDIDPINIKSAVVQPSTLLLVVVVLAMFVLVAVWLRVAPTGRMLRAVGDNKHAAGVLGLPVSRLRLTAFGVSGLIAGVTGLLFAPKAGVSFQSGLGWTLNGFIALVVGGTGSVWAPLIGGLLLGGVQIFVPLYFGSDAPAYAILIIALVFFAFRPEGLFARRVRA